MRNEGRKGVLSQTQRHFPLDFPAFHAPGPRGAGSRSIQELLIAPLAERLAEETLPEGQKALEVLGGNFVTGVEVPARLRPARECRKH